MTTLTNRTPEEIMQELLDDLGLGSWKTDHLGVVKALAQLDAYYGERGQLAHSAMPTVGGNEADTLDELKALAEKALYDLFYKGMEAGEDAVLQRQFDMELGYKHRYAKRCIDGAKDAVIDLVSYGRKANQDTHKSVTSTKRSK